jgi:hypothetical protein
LIDRLVEFDSLPPGRRDGDEDDDKQAKRGEWRQECPNSRVLLFGFLDVDHPLEAYCATCDDFWPISAEERRAILGALSPARPESCYVSYLARGLIKP